MLSDEFLLALASFSFSYPNVRRPTESDDSDSTGWFDASPDISEKQEIEHRQYRDMDIQCDFEISSTKLELENLKSQIQQIALENPAHFPHSTENPSENLNQITSTLKNLQNEINNLHWY